MEPKKDKQEQSDTPILDKIDENPLPQIETFGVPPKKPMSKILLVVLAIVIVIAAAGYLLLKS